MSNRFNIKSITSGYRPIRDGRQYTQYFQMPDERDKIILKDAEVEDTVELMKKVVWKYINDTKKIAPYFVGKTQEDTCRNIWNFLYHHIQYKLDKKGLEELRRPARSWWERQTGIDCDCFSIFVSSILTNLKIPHFFRVTRYDEDYFQHVYVVVSAGDRQYIIDCVLSRFNLEKPYTEKKDFTMSLNGINVAVLSGTAPNVMELVNDLDGLENLGAESNEERLHAIYAHLVKTRNMVAQSPGLIRDVDYPPAFLKMLDYAIANWNTKNRDKALEILAQNEDAFNEHFGLQDIPENSDLEGLENDWDELEGLSDEELYQELNGKKRKEKKKNKENTEREKIPGKKGFFKKLKTAVKKGGKAFVRYNPVTVSARNGFLLAMKLNVMKMASKLKWAYITYVEAKTHGVLEEDWKKSVVALNKIEKLFVDKLQGKKDKLKKAIISGKSGGLKGTGSEIMLGQLGVAPAAAAMVAATPVLLATAKIMSDAGLFKKGEEAGLKDALSKCAGEAESVLQNDPDLKDDPEEGDPSAETTAPKTGKESDDGTTNNDEGGSKIVKPLLIAAGAGLAIWGITAAVSSYKKKKREKAAKNKKEEQLSGLKTQAAKKQTRQKRKARKAKIDRIRLS